MKRVWIRRLTWAVGCVVVVVLLFGVGLILSLDSIVRRGLQKSLARETGAGVRLDQAHLNLFEGSIELRSLVVSNPPGLGTTPLISIPELYIRYDSAAAVSNRLRLSEVRLHLDELNVIIDPTGRNRLTDMAGLATNAGAASSNLWESVQIPEIARLTLTLGRITVTDQRDSRKNMVMDLGITNWTVTDVDSPLKLMPLVLEAWMRGGIQTGSPARPRATNAASVR